MVQSIKLALRGADLRGAMLLESSLVLNCLFTKLQ